MAGSENTTPMPGGMPETSTVYELGKWLGAIIAADRRAEAEREGTALEPEGAQARQRANDMLREAIEPLILSHKAGTLADAAVHVLFVHYLAVGAVDLAQSGDIMGAERRLWIIERLGRSIFDVLAKASGADPAALEASYFLHPAERLWPATVGGDALASFAGSAGL